MHVSAYICGPPASRRRHARPALRRRPASTADQILKQICRHTRILQNSVHKTDLPVRNAWLEQAACLTSQKPSFNMGVGIFQNGARLFSTKLRVQCLIQGWWYGQAHRLLVTQPELLTHLRAQYQYLLVDEYQDSNPIQV